MADQLIQQYISAGTWALVSFLSKMCRHTKAFQIEPHFTERAKTLLTTLISFLEEDCLPNEEVYHSQIPSDPSKRWQSTPQIVEVLKKRAKDLGLWNLWLSGGDFQGMAGGEGGGLSNLEVCHDIKLRRREIDLSFSTV
jgi:acyl-CoA dehydrogenase